MNPDWQPDYYVLWNFLNIIVNSYKRVYKKKFIVVHD